MAEVFDYENDDANDLVIRQGDFSVIESTLQHQKDLLLADKGQYKGVPDAGVGIEQFLNQDVEYDELSSAIQKEFENDGMHIGKLVVKDVDNIEISANYENNSGSR